MQYTDLKINTSRLVSRVDFEVPMKFKGWTKGYESEQLGTRLESKTKERKREHSEGKSCGYFT